MIDEKKIFAQNLNYYMDRHGKTQTNLIDDLGINKSTLSTWCNGLKMPRMGAIQRLADYFGIRKSDLIEIKSPLGSIQEDIPVGFSPIPKMKRVPLLGTIACGEPLMSLEDATEFYKVPEHMHADFCLYCKGDSMINARILDGDIVFIHSQPDVNNGEIAAVEVDGEATLKRVHKIYLDGRLRLLELRAENPNEPTRAYQGEQLSAVRILGKAVAFTSMLR